MIVITGSIRARPEHVDALLALGLEHVRRSRAEPGCLAHAVHRDVEDPLRLVFVEQWADAAAVAAHFALPASQGFVAQAARMASEAPRIEVFDAQPTRIAPAARGSR